MLKRKALMKDFLLWISIQNKIERKKIYQKHIDNIRLIIGFNCSVKDCKDFNISNIAWTEFFYYLRIKYNGFFVNHYGEESPFINASGNNFISKGFEFSFTNFFKINLKWSPIEYYDEIGIIDKIKGKKSTKVTIYINFIFRIS